MQKDRTRYGWSLVCAWPPPVFVIVPGLSAVNLDGSDGAAYASAAPPRKRPTGLLFPPEGTDEAETKCVCCGISATLSVCASSPPLSPSVNPAPTWIGARARRSGRAKLTRPSPPYVVPSSENSAWFWLIG